MIESVIEKFNELAKDYVGTWNAAIEAAAKSIDEVANKKYTIEAFNYHKQLAEQVRKLKK